MCYKAMPRTLSQLTMWLRRCYTSDPRETSQPQPNSEKSHLSNNDKTIESRTSSQTDIMPVQNLKLQLRSSTTDLQLSPTTRERVGVPDCEEYQKMISGATFRVISCPVLQAKKLEARRFCARYNIDDEVLRNDLLSMSELFMELRKERERLLRTVIGALGQRPVIEPPFNFQYGFNIVIGDSFYSNVNLRIMDSGIVTIGDRVLIGPNVTIITELHEKSIVSRRGGNVFAKPVTIEDDCWIGVGTTILPGVTIGKGSVIGAGSTVTRDIPPASVAWGTPARVVESVEDGCTVYDGSD